MNSKSNCKAYILISGTILHGYFDAEGIKILDTYQICHFELCLSYLKFTTYPRSIIKYIINIYEFKNLNIEYSSEVF